jgi:hypothetical protein
MTELSKTRRPYRRLLWLFGLLALAMSIVSVSLVHEYGATRPMVRNDSVGRTHAAKIHDRTVFLTDGEMAAAFGTHAVAILSMATFLGVLMKSRFTKSAGSVNPA